MRAEDILDAIGNVEDSYIVKAKEKRNINKKLWITLGSLAACAALVIGIQIFYATKLITGCDMAPGSNYMAEQTVSRIEAYYGFDKVIAVVNQSILDSPEEVEKVLEFIESITDYRQGIAYPVTDSNTELDPKDIRIYFMDDEGTRIKEYVLNQNSLFDYQTHVEYTLFEAEVDLLKWMLGIEE